jgi:hypothetical protein
VSSQFEVMAPTESREVQGLTAISFAVSGAEMPTGRRSQMMCQHGTELGDDSSERVETGIVPRSLEKEDNAHEVS